MAPARVYGESSMKYALRITEVQHAALRSHLFPAGRDAEDGAGDGHAAIGGGDIQVAGTAFGGLHDDAAATQADGEIASGPGAGESGTFAEFHHATVLQLQHGGGILGGTDLNAVGEVLAGGQHLDSGGQDFVERSEEHTSELQSLRHLVCRLL